MYVFQPFWTGSTLRLLVGVWGPVKEEAAADVEPPAEGDAEVQSDAAKREAAPKFALLRQLVYRTAGWMGSQGGLILEEKPRINISSNPRDK